MAASWFVLGIAGLVIFGLVAILRKVGARYVLLTCLLGLPLLAVASILLALVAKSSAVITHSGQVERMPQIDVNDAQLLAQANQRPLIAPHPQEALPPRTLTQHSEKTRNSSHPHPSRSHPVTADSCRANDLRITQTNQPQPL